MSLLERRLDNVVHRLGFGQSRARPGSWSPTATSRSTAAASTSPATWFASGDVIRVKNRAKSLDLVRGATWPRIAATCPISCRVSDGGIPEGIVSRLPAADDVSIPVQTQLIVELVLALDRELGSQ